MEKLADLRQNQNQEQLINDQNEQADIIIEEEEEEEEVINNEINNFISEPPIVIEEEEEEEEVSLKEAPNNSSGDEIISEDNDIDIQTAKIDLDDNSDVKLGNEKAEEEEEEEDGHDEHEEEEEESEISPSQEIEDDDEVELATATDKDTLMLFAKLQNMNADVKDIEKSFEEGNNENEEEETRDNIEEEEEDAEEEDVFSIDNYKPTQDRDSIELLDMINKLDSEKPLQVFDPAYINDLKMKEHEIQFNEQEGYVYRDTEADEKPYKQRGNKRTPYNVLHAFDCVGLVVDPSSPTKEIEDYIDENFNQADETSIVAARTEDKPLPDHTILTPFSGEIESTILQAYLDFNGIIE